MYSLYSMFYNTYRQSPIFTNISNQLIVKTWILFCHAICAHKNIFLGQLRGTIKSILIWVHCRIHQYEAYILKYILLL